MHSQHRQRIVLLLSVVFVFLLSTNISVPSLQTSPIILAEGIKSPNAQVRYTGNFFNDTATIGGPVILDIDIGTNTVSGYMNFSNGPDDGALCGAGAFSGTRSGNNIQFSFTSSDPDPNCGFDQGWVFNINSTLSGDQQTISGNYSVQGQGGTFTVSKSDRYNGSFTNSSTGTGGSVAIDLKVGTNTVSGYMDFTNNPGEGALCGAGPFSGTKNGSTIQFSFVSNDSDSGCGFDYGWGFDISATISGDNINITNGTYFIRENSQSGIFSASADSPPDVDITPPDGKVLLPADNTTIGPSPVIFSAGAWDNAGGSGVKVVEFHVFYDGSWHQVGTDINPPYQTVWQTPVGLPSQELIFTIHVIDNADNETMDPDGYHYINFVSFSPEHNGYEFHNGNMAHAPWTLFEDTYGRDRVQAWDPWDLRYYLRHYVPNFTGKGGLCFGMTLSSALLFKGQGWVDPGNFLDMQNVSETYDLPEPTEDNNGRWLNSIATDIIPKYHEYQRGQEFINEARNYSQSFSEMVTQIKDSIKYGYASPVIIAIRGEYQGKCNGHAIFPYRYTQSANTIDVSVYDPNSPGVSKTIVFNTDRDTWTYYLGNGIYWNDGGNCAEIKIYPVSLFRSRPTPVWDWDNITRQTASTTSTFHTISVETGAHVLIRDSQGRSLGYINGEFVSEIPNAIREVPLGFVPGAKPEYPEIYYIVSNDN